MERGPAEDRRVQGGGPRRTDEHTRARGEKTGVRCRGEDCSTKERNGRHGRMDAWNSRLLHCEAVGRVQDSSVRSPHVETEGRANETLIQTVPCHLDFDVACTSFATCGVVLVQEAPRVCSSHHVQPSLVVRRRFVETTGSFSVPVETPMKPDPIESISGFERTKQGQNERLNPKTKQPETSASTTKEERHANAALRRRSMDVSQLQDVEEDIVMAVETAAEVLEVVAKEGTNDENALQQLAEKYVDKLGRIQTGLELAIRMHQEKKTSVRNSYLAVKEAELYQRKVDDVLDALRHIEDKLRVKQETMDVA